MVLKLSETRNLKVRTNENTLFGIYNAFQDDSDLLQKTLYELFQYFWKIVLLSICPLEIHYDSLIGCFLLLLVYKRNIKLVQFLFGVTCAQNNKLFMTYCSSYIENGCHLETGKMDFPH